MIVCVFNGTVSVTCVKLNSFTCTFFFGSLGCYQGAHFLLYLVVLCLGYSARVESEDSHLPDSQACYKARVVSLSGLALRHVSS